LTSQAKSEDKLAKFFFFNLLRGCCRAHNGYPGVRNPLLRIILWLFGELSLYISPVRLYVSYVIVCGYINAFIYTQNRKKNRIQYCVGRSTKITNTRGCSFFISLEQPGMTSFTLAESENLIRRSKCNGVNTECNFQNRYAKLGRSVSLLYHSGSIEYSGVLIVDW